MGGLILLAAGLIAYFNSLGGPFIFDDLPAIVENPAVWSLKPIQQALISPPYNTLAGRPIISLSFAINHAIGAFDVRGYHATNIAIHILSSLVLFGVLRRTFRTPRLRERYAGSADGLALAAALLWQVHPLLTETVTYTSNRTEGLMALFFLLTFYCAIRAFNSTRPRGWSIAAVICCAIGMGCKEVMFVAPMLVLLYDGLLVSDSPSDALRQRKGFYIALAATWAIVPLLLHFFVAMENKTGNGFGRTTPWFYALTQSGVIVHYLRLALWPNALTIDYDDWPMAQSLRPVLPQALFIVALLALTAWGLLRRKPAALLGMWFFAILAPTSSFIPLGSEVAAERRMYLPLIAVIVAILLIAHAAFGRAYAALRWPAARRTDVAVVLISFTAIALSLATIWRNGDYATSLLIWSDAARKRPGSSRAQFWLGRELVNANRPLDALLAFEKSVKLRPTQADTYVSIGNILIGQNQPADAAEWLVRAVTINPKNVLGQTNLGLALWRLNKPDEAIARYQKALQIDPGFVDAHFYLAETLESQGKPAAALPHIEAAARSAPEDAQIRAREQSIRSKLGQ